MTQLPSDFKEFLRLLNSTGVEYLIVGGHAVGYHGFPRATGDLDVWVAMTPQNAEKLVTVMREFGFDDESVNTALFLESGRIIRMGHPPIRIEILTSVSGVSFDACYARRVCDVIDDVEVNILNLDDLKTNKRAAGRPKDLGDIDNLP
ncbi:MAG: hypothetical protein GC159_18445 [Phycisphaera sp.]|nr:hypothetical protein [Phycisphaera sp.]